MRLEGWLAAALLLCSCELVFNPGNVPFPAAGGGGGDATGGGSGAGGGAGCDVNHLDGGGPQAPERVRVTRFGPDATLVFFKAPSSAAAYHVIATSSDSGARVELLTSLPVVVHGLTLGAHYVFQVSSVDFSCHEGQPVSVPLGSTAFTLPDDAGLSGALVPQPEADGLTGGYFDAESLADLVTTQSMTTTLERYQDRDGGFTELSEANLSVGPPPGTMRVADFDGDEVDDIALYDQHNDPGPTTVQFVTAATGGSVVAAPSCPVTGIALGSATIELHRSARPQLVVLTRNAADAGSPPGAAFANFVTLATGGCTPGLRLFVDAGSDGVSAGDFDDDGNGDLAFTSQGHIAPVWIWFGDGDGGFSRQALIDAGTPTISVLPVYFAADAGRAIVIDGTTAFSTMLRASDGGFVQKSFTPNPASLHRALVSADLDGDGLTELLCGDSGGSAGSLFLWRPVTNGYPPSPMRYDGGAVQGVAVVDVDGDHKLDVVTLEGPPSLTAGLRIRRGH